MGDHEGMNWEATDCWLRNPFHFVFHDQASLIYTFGLCWLINERYQHGTELDSAARVALVPLIYPQAAQVTRPVPVETQHEDMIVRLGRLTAARSSS